MTLAGEPAKITSLPKDLVTVEFAPTTTLFPKVTPGKITELAPSHTLSPIVTGLPVPINFPRKTGSRGWSAA